MKKIRVGIIGTGSISRAHFKAYNAHPDVEVYALCDIHEGRLQDAGKEFGVERLYTNVDEMLALPEIDAVSVCTWNSEHASCTIKALNAGKHVLCEKPMATNVEDAIAMKEAAEKNGKLLMIGFIRRFGSDMKVLKDLIDTDYLGDIYYTKAKMCRRNGNPMGWFGDKTRSGGGPLIDLGVHVIDFVRYALGNPQPVSVYGATFRKLGARNNIKTPKAYVSKSATGNDLCDVEDIATAMMRFDNGTVLHIETSFSLNTSDEKGDISFYGTKAGVSFGDKMVISTEVNDYLADVELVAETRFDFKYFVDETNHFIDCIMNGTECKNPAQDGVDMMKILAAIYESAETGHEVIIK